LLREAIRYNWIAIVLFVVGGVALGGLAAHVKVAKYTSSTTLLVNPLVGNPYTPESNSDVLEMLQTEAVAVTSSDVVDTVLSSLNLDITPQLLRAQTGVAVPPNTQALQISYTSSNRLLAPEVADEVAAQYLAQRKSNADDVIAQRKQLAQDEVDQTQKLLDEANNNNQSALIQGYKSELLDARARLASVNALADDPGHALNPAVTPPNARLKHYAIFGIAGGIAAGLVGLAFALWRERRRDLIRSASDLDDYPFDAPVTAIHGADLDEDALRHLRMRLAPQIRNHGIVALVGLAPGHALATGVLLGESLAKGNTSVVLIDGTGTEPGHRDILEFDGRPGLAQALTASSPTPPTAFKVRRNFGYLPAGPDPIAASERLVDDRAVTVVHGVAERYDLTLVACMPLDQAEGEAMARLTLGVILLVEVNRTKHFELGRALKAVNDQGQTLVGVFVLPTGT
jgi:capsular polysaccharide biosynthesis protein/Mrp family chromosome partitioning ATPase